MAVLMFLLLTNIGMKLTQPQVVQNEMTKKMQRMEKQIENSTNILNAVQKQIKDLTRRIQTIQTNSWPSGSYCILQSGPCPTGFTSKSGYMRAIQMYAGNGAYMKAVTFGDSIIKCHDNCARSNGWIGDIYLNSCCK